MIATAAALTPETTLEPGAYDFSSRYTAFTTTLPETETIDVAHASGALLSAHRDMLGFVSEHCRPAVSAMVAYADYLLTVVGSEMAPERRALLQLIRSDGSDLLRGISAIVGPTGRGR